MPCLATKIAATKQTTPIPAIAASSIPRVSRREISTLGGDDDQGADRAADDPADVAADADVGRREREHEVDHQPEAELLDDVGHAALAGDQDRRDEEAVDRARRADREGRRVGHDQRPDRRRRPARRDRGRRSERADRRLEHLAEDEEDEHVEGEVDQPAVEESGADDPPPLAAGRVDDLAATAADPAVADRVSAQSAPSAKSKPSVPEGRRR